MLLRTRKVLDMKVTNSEALGGVRNHGQLATWPLIWKSLSLAEEHYHTKCIPSIAQFDVFKKEKKRVPKIHSPF